MAIRINYIFPECYVDTNILKTLLQVDGVNHQYGCSRVMTSMNTERYANSFAIGIIDDDKKKTYNYHDFIELCRSEHLVLMKHQSKHHYLIFVYKAAEEFLLACANELGLKMSEYGLPNTLEDLKSVTKDNESDKDPKIKKLVNAVRPSTEMGRLDRVIKYLQEKRYDADVDELIASFIGSRPVNS